MEQLLTPKQLSGILQVSPSTVYQWTHTGFIPHIKLGGNVRFRPSDVEKWLNKRARKGRSTYKIQIDGLLTGRPRKW